MAGAGKRIPFPKLGVGVEGRGVNRAAKVLGGRRAQLGQLQGGVTRGLA